ncbi:hypothetical protein [Algoriphagus aquimarinus]|uniref:Lipoprotein n=1 Tax=Algoriphagus aquimarinus TaxID=237018 RepID=A0A1I1CJM9_9BACT|nr:hypothetical protein [Algoriphagus aquimarinus]SFB61108.1 hypothetical protein SAMN04489723_13220 [Algoriphagus aquimarinus]
MKIFTTKMLALVTSALLLGACSQMATYENEDLLANQEVAAKSGFNLTPYGTGGNENAYQVDSYFTYSSESYTICYDEAGSFTVSFFAQNTAIACGNFMIQYAIFEEGVDLDALDWQNLTETNPSSGVVSATLTGLPTGEYTFRGQWLRTGSPTSCSTSFVNTGWRYATENLIVEECSDCDIDGNEFSGEAVTCGASREVNYTFGSEEGLSYFKMQGGLTNFTGDNAVIMITGGSNLSVVQATPGGSSNRIITVEGAVGECETITVNVKWNSTNSGGIITGNWSVKDADGDDLDAPVAGLTCS